MTGQGSTGNGSDFCAIYVRASPAAATANVVVTYAGGVGNNARATNYDGVDPVTPVGTYVGDTDGSLAVTSEVGGLVVDVHSHYNFTPTQGAGQTLEQFQNNGGVYQSAAYSKEDGAATVTMSWSGGSARAQGALPINAA